MSELLWLTEDELRDACRILANRLCQTEHRLLLMAVSIEKAVEYGYRVGYEDGVEGEPYSFSGRDVEGLVLH